MTFSRRWHAPPPLMQLRLLSTLLSRQWRPCAMGADSLVGAVNGHVYGWVLIDIPN